MGRYGPAQLNPMHRRQLLLLSDGAMIAEVAKATSRSVSQVTHLKNSQRGREHLQALIIRKEQGAIQNSLVGLCVERLRDIIEDPNVDARIRLKAIENVLDRDPDGTFSLKRGVSPGESRVFDSRAIEALKKDAARLGLSSHSTPSALKAASVASA